MIITIPADAPRIPHKKHWQFCVGSGHALLALRTDYTQQLKFIHDTLGIERVRFHGIFCDDMRTRTDLSQMFPAPGAEKFTEENFRACGLAYDNVLEAGMKPFVELSFMPKKLSEAGQEGVFFYKPCVDPPADGEVWAGYIRRFVRFLLHRYGVEEVRSWFFEVWNEPDLQVVFFSQDREAYFRLYETTARAIKAVDPALQVGGPATSGSKWVAPFLRFCAEYEVPVDFITTHQYAGDPLGGVEDKGEELEEERHGGGESWPERIRKMGERLAAVEEKTFLAGYRAINPDQSEETLLPNDSFRKNAAVVRRQAGSLPVYYTEWNCNAGFASYTNDTRKVAAYDVKAALDVAESVDGSSIWCFSDIFEELHPFVQEFHGGFGMLTQSGIPKPVYHAMKLLADAPDTRLDLGPDATDGEIGVAAFENKTELHVLLFRQKMKNFALPKEEAVVNIELPDAPKAVTLQRIDEEHGNPLKRWEEMGKPDYLNRAEVEALKEKSAVKPEPWPFAYSDDVLTLRASLGVNDVYGFVIQKGE